MQQSVFAAAFVRHRWLIAAVFCLALAAAAVLSAGVVKALSLSRFQAPQSESMLAAQELDARFGVGSFNVLILASARAETIDDPDVRADIQAVAARLAAWPGVVEVETPWSNPARKSLVSVDRRRALILARMPGTATEVRGRLATLSPAFTRQTDHLVTGVGGSDEVFRQLGAQAARDFIRAELIIFPACFLFLWVHFRSATAAALPLLVGLFAMAATLALLRWLATAIDISTFALNLTLILGLGLGVDYGLLVVTRFRQAMAEGLGARDAVAASWASAAATVLSSGLTVAASLSALLFFPSPFLRSFAMPVFRWRCSPSWQRRFSCRRSWPSPGRASGPGSRQGARRSGAPWPRPSCAGRSSPAHQASWSCSSLGCPLPG
jgi:RND superfamily putative drug exporter